MSGEMNNSMPNPSRKYRAYCRTWSMDLGLTNGVVTRNKKKLEKEHG